MKLKTHLRECTIEQLKSIAEYWDLIPSEPAQLEDHDALAEHLYPRMQTANHFRAAFEALNETQREWIYFLALHGGELPVDEMRKRCGFESAQQMNDALAGLTERGFVWRERMRDKLISTDLVGIPEPFVRLVDLPPYWRGFLGFYLQELGTDELRGIIRTAFDERPPTRKKQALAHYIRRQLLTPESLQATVGRLDPLQMEMFEYILQKNGVCAWKDLLDSGVHKKFDHARAEKLRDLIENSGMVFIYQSAANKYNNLLIVPRDIASMIQSGYKRDDRALHELGMTAGVEPRRTSGGMGGSNRPGVILDNSNAILRDLVIVCAHVHRNQIKMLNNGGVGRNDLKKIAPLLSHNKTIKYVAFLLLFAIVKKLVIHVGTQWRVSGALSQWLERGQGCFRDLYEFWLTTNEWNEEYIDGDVLHADNYPQNLVSITELRKLVLNALEKTPANTWVDFETFAESLLPQISIEIPGRSEMIPSEKFNRHPRLILESIIAETLYWMGVVMLGVSEMEAARRLGSRTNEEIAPYDPSRPLATHLIGGGHFLFQFRLTEFGATLLQRNYLAVDKLFGKGPDPSLPYGTESAFFTVQPNLEIVTPPDLKLASFFGLMQFCDIKKVDIMTTLSITRESVRGGLDFGMMSEEMVRILSEGSRKEMPEVVRQMVMECESRHGEVDMGLAGGYLHVTDPLRMAELKANPKIQPSVKDVLEDKVMLLSRTADFRKIAKELQRLGYMPHVDSDSMHETNDGLFQITLRPEELYDLLAVLRFCIMMEEEGEIAIFDDRVRPLFQRLSVNAKDRFNPNFYAESIAKAFIGNYEKKTKKAVDTATQKYRKQLNRLITSSPRSGRKERAGYKGENPARDPKDITKLMKYAIEQEKQVRIKYMRTNGETFDTIIEPEAIQGKKLYALDTENDDHHLYTIERIKISALVD